LCAQAAAAGAPLLCAAFGVRLADTWHKQGQPVLAAEALDSAAARLAAAPAAAAAGAAGRRCGAEAACLRARLHLSASALAQARLACDIALEAAEQAEELAGAGAGAALVAQARLAGAECLAARGEAAAALEQAGAALEALGSEPCCLSGRVARVQLLLFLASHGAGDSAAAPPLDRLRVWGVVALGDASSGAAPAKRAAGGGRGARAQEAPSSGDAGADVVWTHLWAAYELSGDLPHLQRLAAARLAELCGARGRLHLAAALLHGSMGATMQLQHRLVLHTRAAAAAQRRRRGAEPDAGAEAATAAAARALPAGLDPELVRLLARGGDASSAAAAAPAARQGRRGGKAAAPAPPPAPAPAQDAAAVDAALEALDAQAAATLSAWLASLPAGTAACTLGVHPRSLPTSLAPMPGGPAAPPPPWGDRVVVSRLQAGRAPLLVELPVAALQAGGPSSHHPIRALRLDDEEEEQGGGGGAGGAAGGGGGATAVQSAVAEMQGVLDRSARSMRELGTDTRDEQRAWWRARAGLDDALAALVQHLDDSWLGPWRCLLMGAPRGDVAAQHAAHAAAALAELEALQLDQGGGAVPAPALPLRGAPRDAALVLLEALAHGREALTPGELRRGAAGVCGALGMGGAGGRGAAAAAAAILARPPPRPAAPRPSACEPATVARRVKFQAPAGDEDGADLSPAPVLRRAAHTADAEPRSAVAGNLCGAFDALALDPGRAGAAPAAPASTVRAKKHKSRSVGGGQI
jgi:separase